MPPKLPPSVVKLNKLIDERNKLQARINTLNANIATIKIPDAYEKYYAAYATNPRKK